MTTFPCLVYRAPGSIQRARYSYDSMPMHGQAQLDAKLASGWHMTLEAAIEAAGPLAARHLMGRKSKNPRRTPVKQKPPVERRASMVKAAKKQKPAPAFAPEPVAPIVDDNAPPTREELEAKAIELAVPFNKRTSDKKLAGLIETALAQQTQGE